MLDTVLHFLYLGVELSRVCAMERVNYVVFATVKAVHEGTEVVGVGFQGGKASFARRSIWFVNFEHSHEALFLGNEKPVLSAGDRVKITFERLAA
jgi:hypothetical protein